MKIVSRTFWFALIAQLLLESNGFAVYSRNEKFSLNKSTCLGSESESSGGIEVVSLERLSSDHEAEGTRMALSLAGWLDQEWMPQQVHKDMAESAKQSYIKCRLAGENDIMSVMYQVGQDLESNWKQYDDDGSFVNAWDVSNYVSDYLNDRTGNESCECSAQIFDPNSTDEE